MREEVPVCMNSEIRIQFKYNDGNKEDLDQLNQMLAAMDLTNVKVENLTVYLCTTQEFDHEVVTDTSYRCGLGSGVLVCGRVDGEKIHRYQLSTEVYEAGAMEGNAFADYWRGKYPERKLSTVITYGFDAHEAVVVVYFNEIAE